MSRKGLAPNARRRLTNAERDALREVIAEIADAEQPITVRGLFYRVMSRGLVPKTEAGYRTVQGETLRMRRRGDLPYGWITDGSRRRLRLRAYSGLDQVLNETARLYRRRLWDDQDVYIEVWTEKDAITGVVQPVTLQYDVPLVVAKGYASETFLWEAAEEIMEVDKPTFIYQLGDHDRDGVQAFDTIAAKLRDFVPGEIPITFERIAVTPNQIDELGLPTRPDKTDSGFGDCVEVDAIDSITLRALVTESIERHIDQDALRITEIAEDSEREVLRRIAGEHGDSADDADVMRRARKAHREAEHQKKIKKAAALSRRAEALAELREVDSRLADFDRH